MTLLLFHSQNKAAGLPDLLDSLWSLCPRIPEGCMSATLNSEAQLDPELPPL